MRSRFAECVGPGLTEALSAADIATAVRLPHGHSTFAAGEVEPPPSMAQREVRRSRGLLASMLQVLFCNFARHMQFDWTATTNIHNPRSPKPCTPRVLLLHPKPFGRILKLLQLPSAHLIPLDNGLALLHCWFAPGLAKSLRVDATLKLPV